MHDIQWTSPFCQSVALLVFVVLLVFIPSSLSFAQDPAWDCLDDKSQYKVVINHEEQYSIWPVGRELPAGWQEVGKQGTKQECLDFIEEVWTDMRPLSFRRSLEKRGGESGIDSEKVKNLDLDGMKHLVSYLKWLVEVGKIYLQEEPETGQCILNQIHGYDIAASLSCHSRTFYFSSCSVNS